ncbi:hypothetical protein V8E54_010775 [Elaphomyces granulatus]
MGDELLPHEFNWIDDGNIAAHSGNCKYDVQLYCRSNRPRKDYKVCTYIYGIAPGIVLTWMLTIAVEDNATIHLWNTHAELAGSKYKVLPPNIFSYSEIS